MDYPALQAELLRAFRGHRSQAAMSRQLGFRSNVVFDWESGRRQPTAAKAFRCARVGGVDVSEALRRFTGLSLDVFSASLLESDLGVAALMVHFRGTATLRALAEPMGVSRYTMGRWLKGDVSPSFAEFLEYIEHATLRVVDLCAELADPEALPSLTDAWQRLHLARELAYDHPLSHVVLRVLELASYKRLCRHEPGFMARRLGISINEEKRLLQLLEASGQIEQCRGRYTVIEARAVDTRRDPKRSRQLRAFFSELATERLRAGRDGEFAFGLLGVSWADLERIRTLQREHYAELRRIVGQSEPLETVVLTNLQLVPLAH